MGRARFLVEAVVLGRRSPTELARSHPISLSWLYELLHRFREGGYPALEPRSRRPRSCPHQVGAEVQAAIFQLRQELTEAGDDAGPGAAVASNPSGCDDRADNRGDGKAAGAKLAS